MLSFRRTHDTISGSWDKTQSKMEEEESNILNYLTPDEVERDHIAEENSFMFSVVLLSLFILFVIILFL